MLVEEASNAKTRARNRKITPTSRVMFIVLRLNLPMCDLLQNLPEVSVKV